MPHDTGIRVLVGNALPDNATTALLKYWNALAMQNSKTPLSGTYLDNGKLVSPFQRDYEQARVFLAAPVVNEGAYQKWVTVANQYARLLKVAEFQIPQIPASQISDPASWDKALNPPTVMQRILTAGVILTPIALLVALVKGRR